MNGIRAIVWSVWAYVVHVPGAEFHCHPLSKDHTCADPQEAALVTMRTRDKDPIKAGARDKVGFWCAGTDTCTQTQAQAHSAGARDKVGCWRIGSAHMHICT